MRSLRRRLEQLEGKTENSVEESGWYQRYLWIQRHYFPLIENYHREQQGLDPLPVPEEEPDPEFEAFWEHYLEANEKNDPEMIQANTEWWHRMRWERYGISGQGQTGFVPTRRPETTTGVRLASSSSSRTRPASRPAAFQ